MSLKKNKENQKSEKMSNRSFKGMVILFNIIDFFYPYIKKRVKKFGIQKGMTVVDYGCGPGRYAVKFAELVGDEGKVYAADIHELAIEEVQKKIKKHNLKNIEPILINGYNSALPDNIANIVCAIDMFFIIQEPKKFLGELKRITKTDGVLVIDDGHQRRRITKEKILDSGFWKIIEETRDHLKCKPG